MSEAAGMPHGAQPPGPHELVRRAPPADGWRFDPAAFLRAVNGLAGLDPAAALAVLTEVADELSVDASGVVLVARALFLPGPDAPPPAPPLGRADVEVPPGDENAWPFFPLTLVRDVPFLLVSGYRVGGAMNVSAWLAGCAAVGRVRQRPLAPETAPIEAADSLTREAAWDRLVPAARRDSHVAMIRGQALRAIGRLGQGSAGATETTDAQDAVALASLGPEASERRWLEEATAARDLRLRWDPASGRFGPTDHAS